MSETYVGIDVGGTNIKIGLFDFKLKVICKTSVTTEADMGPDVVIDKMAQTVEELLTKAGLSLKDIAAVGIGTPGPAKYSEGIIIKSTNMPKFKNVPICKMLNEKLGAPIVFDNDANVACWGEYAVGAGKGVKDMVFFTLGTGIGGGIVSNGELVHGCDENAAELGHMIIYPDGRKCNCGQRGCVEAYASADSTARRAREAIQAGVESSLKKVLDEKFLFSIELEFQSYLDNGIVSEELRQKFKENDSQLLKEITVLVEEPGSRWLITDKEKKYSVRKKKRSLNIYDEKGQITSKDVYEHLAAGDKLAKEITDGTAKALAITCINMLHTTEPKRIVFAGGMIAAGDVLLNRIKDFFNEHIWTLKKEAVEICFATLGEDAGIIGAAALAQHAKQRGKLK